MQLMRRDQELWMRLRDAMERLFEDSFIMSGPFSFPTGRMFPIDISENDNNYIVEAALPGRKPEDIEITAMGETLTIRTTQKREEKTEKEGRYVRQERYEGEMSRVITLPGNIDPDKVQATYEHGMLKLEIPKAQAQQSKRIQVQTKEPASATP
ncbi:MAG TPA: Hsp20/alpha crystallin family protein [Ktedonobacteraceae bacterium]|nr:Hsp20/alpha crystallin family protein [Ktedonobacteraceae bacterium]